ncbi:hypothetical protein EVAR_44677_1 [Eumeta japonica]|uniref:Uncharacterized protein n=1 Tax=Eumeta variegata TaxID=151549 RepID=A0A4C1Y2L7_EUMVA|nr:hypothetical protein EVAR_44677_1 [Eumeta japonica]
MGSALDLLASYLTNRIQKVNVNDMRSSASVARIGEPQGLILVSTPFIKGRPPVAAHGAYPQAAHIVIKPLYDVGMRHARTHNCTLATTAICPILSLYIIVFTISPYNLGPDYLVLTVGYLEKQRSKRVHEPPKNRWSLSLMDTHNSRGVTSALPAFWIGIRYLTEVEMG